VTQQTDPLPLMDRVDRFERRHHDILIAAPWSTRSGRWQVIAPGHDAKSYDNGRAMMDDLEARYSKTPEFERVDGC
jgi:hypothetical protein